MFKPTSGTLLPHSFLRKARVVLEDGSVFYGETLLDESTPEAEFVFNTATTGYEEVLTDPSYKGQVVVFTTPHLGTTGWTAAEQEHASITVSGVVSRKISEHFDNFLGKSSLYQVLQKAKVPFLTGVDTRALALKLRNHGTMIGKIELVPDAQDHPPDFAKVPEPALPAFDLATIFPAAAFPQGGSFFATGNETLSRDTAVLRRKKHSQHLKIAIIDFGVKKSILDELTKRGCDLDLIPWDQSTFEKVTAAKADGVLFSNGPGDPRILLNKPELLQDYRKISSEFVSFGICFGHQALALAYGARIVKLGYGHHALNHPVVRVEKNGKFSAVYITSQNHNYAVDPLDFPAEFNITFNHLNDGTIAGLAHKRFAFSSVQFHPEAGPGPRETNFLFCEFIDRIRSRRCN